MVAGVEMTGTYHIVAKQALSKVCDVKMIHPLTTKQLRQPASPGIKTDDTDLDAQTRAMIAGYGIDEPELPELYVDWRCLTRMREDLVKKDRAVKAQCQEKLEALMPGYSKLFGKAIWERPGPWEIVRLYRSAEAVARAGVERIADRLRRRKMSMRRNTIRRVVAWAGDACGPLPGADLTHRTLVDSLKLHRTLAGMIADYERELLCFLVQTPAVVLVSIQGVNVVSASVFGAELGPVCNYPEPTNICGRAGLFPSRYQSDETDRRDGPVVRGHNARLRQSIFTIARNLGNLNDYYSGFRQLRERNGWDGAKIDAAVAGRFSRAAFHMLVEPAFFNHPKCTTRDAVLPKLLCFAWDHGMAEPEAAAAVLRAVESFPRMGLELEIQALETGRGVKGRPYPAKLAGAARNALTALWKRVDTEQPGGGTAIQN